MTIVHSKHILLLTHNAKATVLTTMKCQRICVGGIVGSGFVDVEFWDLDILRFWARNQALEPQGRRGGAYFKEPGARLSRHSPPVALATSKNPL